MSERDEIEAAQRSIVDATGSVLGAVSDLGARPPHWYWRRAARAWEDRAQIAEERLRRQEEALRALLPSLREASLRLEKLNQEAARQEKNLG